jgi:hypothetical protein
MLWRGLRKLDTPREPADGDAVRLKVIQQDRNE